MEQTTHYYPYGGTFASSTTGQPYKYNGKELDNHNGLNWYDYGARHYDPAIARWMAIELAFMITVLKEKKLIIPF